RPRIIWPVSIKRRSKPFTSRVILWLRPYFFFRIGARTTSSSSFWARLMLLRLAAARINSLMNFLYSDDFVVSNGRRKKLIPDERRTLRATSRSVNLGAWRIRLDAERIFARMIFALARAFAPFLPLAIF